MLMVAGALAYLLIGGYAYCLCRVAAMADARMREMWQS